MNGSNLSNESAQVTFGSYVAPDDFWATSKVLWFGAIIITLIVLVVGNGLVLYCIAYCRFLQNPADIFVAVLAGVDLTFAISMVMGLVELVKPMVFTGLRACQFKLILAISNSLASGFALLGIAVTRYLGTFKPFLYETLVTSRRVAYIAVFIVVYPASMLTGLTLHYHHWQPHVPCDYFMVYPPGVTLFIHMHLYLFLPALGIIYLKIALEVARSNRRVAALTPAPLAESPQDRVAAVPGQVLEEQQRQRLNLRTLKNFGIVVGLYATCCLPYTLLCQVLVTDPFYYLQQPTTMHVFKVIKVMFVINSVINPIVYAIRFKRFGLAFRYAFKCISKDDLERYISVQFK